MQCIMVKSKLQYYPLPTHSEMAQYTHLELSKRPYKYKKGLFELEADKQNTYDITVSTSLRR